MQSKLLNQEQLKAVKHGQGPLLIIAGAGTGKTTVITERIKYLILSNLAKPSEILALTFTEKAAIEMEERVDKLVPYGYTQMWISTFHSFCDRILKDEVLDIGLDPYFTLMTQAETIIFLKKNLFEFKLNYFRPATNPNKFLVGLLTHFNRLQDEDISPENYLNYAEKLKKIKNNLRVDKQEVDKTLELVKAYKKYQELKIKNSVMDFADLISNTLKLFRNRKNILKNYQNKFKYILVDEFQDTNIAQNNLIFLLAGKKANLTVVGDDDQSIYKWRGAAISSILQFKKNYPQSQLIGLNKNYRSSQEILNKAYDLIQHNNPDRLEVKEKMTKKLIAVKKIKFILEDRVENEAEIMVSKIKKLIANNNYNLQFKNIAVLVRANNHADPFVRSFIRQGIPFQFLGPGRLFRQEEVLDLIAYLKLLDNFEDNVSFFRVLSLELFDISGRDIAAIGNFARKQNSSFFEVAEQVDKILLSDRSKKMIEKIVKMVYRHLDLIAKETAGQILYYFLQDSGLLAKLADIKSEKQEQQANNIAKFFDKLKAYESEHEDASVSAIVDWINLKMEIGESPLASDLDWTKENKVNILTVHSAKGLEFPVVFLVNLVSDRFPTRRRSEQIPIPDDLVKEVLPSGDSHEQEERRLFYVGMTRAKMFLYLTAAKFYGEGKRKKRISPFVFEALGNDCLKIKAKSSKNQLSIFDFRPATTVPFSHLSQLSYKPSFISYSQLETFIRCPLQYRYQYIIKIPTPASEAVSFGISLHQSLKEFYKLILTAQKPSKKDLKDILAKCWQKEGFSSKKHEKNMFSKAEKYLLGFYQKGFSIKDKPVSLEQPFIIKISNNLKIKGRFDRVDKLINGGIEIIDYKTGKIKQQSEIDKNLQMTVYAIAAADPGILNKEPKNIKLSFYFLEIQEKISTQRTKKQLDQARKDIISIVNEIGKSDFLPNPGPYCDFCQYKLLCPAWQ